MSRIILVLTFFAAALFSCNEKKEKENIQQWNVYEISFSGPSEGNPYMDITLEAVFKTENKTVSVPGFYDGNGMYRIRFSPDKQGEWTWETNSNSEELANKSGEFICIAPAVNNHGPLKIVNTFYLEYADNTPFYAVGTTAYQWTSVKQSIQEKTLETLAGAPFNKIRMCVFPKSYRYGNDTEPWMYPYKREGEHNDFTKPNYEFFQNFDQRVKQLLELEIQADVILFHPYDSWGYSEMGKEMNEKYVRYMISLL